MGAPSVRRPAWWPTEVEVELLRALLGGPEAVLGLWRLHLRSGELERLRGDAARLRPQLYERLCEAGASAPGVSEVLPLRRAYAEVRSLNARTRTEAREALGALAARGIAPMLLKGLALDAMADESGTRRIGDLDLMVRREALGGALAALREAGWNPIDSVAPGALDAKHSTCLRRSDSAEVDLHWVLSGRLAVESDPDAAMAPFWERARPATYRGVAVWVLHPMHQVLHLVAHGALVESRAAVRWLADAAFVLRRAPAEAQDWALLVDTGQSLRLSLHLWSALLCFDHVFAGVVPRPVLEELRASRRSLGERLLWLVDSRTVRRPLALDVLRTLRAHLSNQRFRALPAALLLYPRYLVANGYLVSPSQLARHVARRRRERRERTRTGA
jgi:hypothetical protein